MAECVDARMPGTTSSPGFTNVERSPRAGREIFTLKLAIEFARLTHVFALLPEIEIGGAENVTRLGEYRLTRFGQAADVVGMAMVMITTSTSSGL